LEELLFYLNENEKISMADIMKIITDVYALTVKLAKEIEEVKEVIVYRYERIWNTTKDQFEINEIIDPTPAADIIEALICGIALRTPWISYVVS